MSIFEGAAPAFQEQWDYRLAGEAAPAGIMQLEGLLRVAPENQDVLMNLAKSYVGYSFGFVEDELQRADPSDFDRQDHLRYRARLMYVRARNLMFKYMELEKGGFHEARRGGLETLERWLAEECTEREDAGMLMWAGQAWALAIGMSLDDPDMVADVSAAVAIIEKSAELDERYENSAALSMMAIIKSDFPEALGGEPERGRELFERALELTDRKILLIHLNYARTYAVRTGNRELFDELIAEIIEAGDISPSNRLSNKIARRRAIRLRTQAFDLF